MVTSYRIYLIIHEICNFYDIHVNTQNKSYFYYYAN